MHWQHARLRHVLPQQDSQQFTMMTLTLDPGGKTPVRACRRRINSVSVVLDGTIQMEIREQSFLLKKMEAIYFDLSAPHQWINLGEGPAQILRLHPYMFHLFEQEEEELIYLKKGQETGGVAGGLKVENSFYFAGLISTAICTSTAAPAGRLATPMAARAWRPCSPNTSTRRSEAPLITLGASRKSGVQRT